MRSERRFWSTATPSASFGLFDRVSDKVRWLILVIALGRSRACACRDEFNERRKEWQSYLRQQKETKYKEWMERKAQRQAEYEAQKKAYEEEQAKRDPWEEEKAICEQLIVFVEKHVPKKEEVHFVR